MTHAGGSGSLMNGIGDGTRHGTDGAATPAGRRGPRARARGGGSCGGSGGRRS